MYQWIADTKAFIYSRYNKSGNLFNIKQTQNLLPGTNEVLLCFEIISLYAVFFKTWLSYNLLARVYKSICTFTSLKSINFRTCIQGFSIM